MSNDEDMITIPEASNIGDSTLHCSIARDVGEDVPTITTIQIGGHDIDSENALEGVDPGIVCREICDREALRLWRVLTIALPQGTRDALVAVFFKEYAPDLLGALKGES